jgi:hypothetical protein
MTRSSLTSLTKVGSAFVLIATLVVTVGVVATVVVLFPGLWLLAYVAAAALIALLVATVTAFLFTRVAK